ncbi:MAG TPA: SDR family oxidoreductase [Streptosporangiaceae bacterium]|nr:SDR family oxidoreductase [Streptosporangiaceae bacterium]
MITYDYRDHCVLVTGGTRGIGAGIAAAFLAAGADVVVCARHEPPDPPAAAGRAASFAAADVRDAAQVDALIETVVDRHGRLDVVVNNAGGSPYAPAAAASPRLHAKVIELNLTAALHVAQRAHRVMSDQETGGAIVMIGSVSGVRPSPGTAAYGAAKAGLHHLAACLAAEWAPKVRVNTVIAGLVDTGSGDEQSDHYGDAATRAAIGATIPAGRLARPADVAQACLFLAGPQASYITGAALQVHGGGEHPAWSGVVRPR